VRKKFAGFSVIIVALFLVIFIINTSFSRKYSSRIELDFSPLAASAYVDGHRQKPGVVRVAPGKHTISVRLDGFADEQKVVSVKKTETMYVGLSLLPNSPKTTNWYTAHPEDQRIAERISGRNTDSAVNKALELEPFIKELPFIGPGFSYQVGVGATNSNGRPTIVIHAQSDEAIADAKQWIRSMGYNPDSMHIIINPDQEIDTN
jgi:hypothetical protein